MDAATVLAGWLSRFEAALSAGDAAAAADLFAVQSYWRDLIAFTWNIKTMEGRGEITAMLDATLPATRPNNWRLQGEPDEAGGVISGWITFDTAIARGVGHVRLKDGLCWTLLTTMTELKGHEERRGLTREMGTEHGARRDRHTWLERKQKDEAELGFTYQPYCLIVGGGQGRAWPWRQAEAPGCTDHHRGQAPTAR
jgi:putative flavoprotein involved in K+ transport